MLCKFKNNWNYNCDFIHSLLCALKNNKISQNLLNSKFVVNVNNFCDYNFPLITNFIKQCDHNNYADIVLLHKHFKITYNLRSNFVSTASTVNSIFGYSYLKTYFWLSLFFCRENFNALNYKFTMPCDKCDCDLALNNLNKKI